MVASHERSAGEANRQHRCARIAHGTSRARSEASEGSAVGQSSDALEKRVAERDREVEALRVSPGAERVGTFCAVVRNGALFCLRSQADVTASEAKYSALSDEHACALRCLQKFAANNRLLQQEAQDAHQAPSTEMLGPTGPGKLFATAHKWMNLFCFASHPAEQKIIRNCP
eukprot:SAG31_NODE_1745_length_7379_cov_8.772115_10_plen_172_part_00